MAQDTDVKNLIINKLTRAQYESIANPDPTQLYFITDEVISSTDVTNALGYTPYNSSNPNGYTSNVGTVTSVNNVEPVNGNVTISIPDVSNFVTNSSLATTLGDYALLYNDVDFNSVNTQLITFGNELTSISSETDSDSETGASNLIIYGSNISLGADNSINFSGTNFTFNNNEVATQTWVSGQGFITSADLPTNHVTTDTTQNITGTKTFVGQKKIAFKQSGTSDKLGFTLYNNSGTEKGYLEYNPSNTVDGVPLMTLGNYATASGGLTHVGFRKYSSISGASGAYNLLTPLISDAKTPFSLTTTYTNFYLPLGFTDGTTTVKTAKSGMVDLSSIIPTATSDLTNDSGFITSIPTATSSTLGMVQPDNTTITIDGNGVISSNVASRNVGEIIQSTIPLTDAGLHLLDGSLLAYGSYQAFIDYIADLYDSGNYDDIFETEANWQSSVTTYGVCGKFVYDSVNQTVRLPKITGFTEGTIDPTVLGDLVEAGLPNITGNIDRVFGEGTYNGALYRSDQFYVSWVGSTNAGVGTKINIDASRSSSIYGNSTTVQPQAIKVLYYIVIANTTKTEIQIDIDEIATDLNNKADTDLSNVTDSGTSTGAGWAMPSDTYIDLTLGASGSTYTAPANGWFFIDKRALASGQYLELSNHTSGMAKQTHAATQYDNLTVYIPAISGDIVKVGYNTTGDTNAFKFIYAQGSKN